MTNIAFCLLPQQDPNMIKYTTYTLKKLEQLFEELGFRIRYEKGTFQSGYCIVFESKVVVINKFFDTEARINTLLDILSEIDIDEPMIAIMTEKSQKFYRQLVNFMSHSDIK